MTLKKMICCLAFLIPALAIAQTNYQPGYIVNFKRDTLKGYIDYRNWLKNPKTVIFKDSRNSAEQVFEPDNIKAFGVNRNEIYESFKVSISQNHIEDNDIASKIDTSSIIQQVFLRVLTKGKNLSLYNYNDDIKSHYYIAEKDNPTVTELRYMKYINQSDGEKVVVLKRYSNQLTALANKYERYDVHIEKLIAQATYSEADLIGVVKYINNKTEVNTEDATGRTGVRFLFGIGIKQSSLKYTGDIDLANSKTSKSVFPRVDVGFDILPNKNSGSILIRTELAFTISKFSTSAPADLIKFDQKALSISPQFIYNFYNKPQTKIYFGVAPALNLFSYSNSEHWLYYNATNYSIDKSTSYFQKAQFTVTGKLGTELSKKVDLFTFYQLPSSITKTINYSGKVSQYGFGLNYLLGK